MSRLHRYYLLVAATIPWVGVFGSLILGVTPDWVDLVAICAAAATGVSVLILIRRKLDRAFVHGYHAGYHDASRANCCYPEPCDVLTLSEARAKQAV